MDDHELGPLADTGRPASRRTAQAEPFQRLRHPFVTMITMTTDPNPKVEFPPLTNTRSVPRGTPIGTVVDRWDCPCCGHVIEMIHRPGRPRLYCSHACRQRAYRLSMTVEN
jgi:hypothetical protein